MATELTPKRLQLLKEIVSSAKRVAILWNATDRSMDLRAQEAVHVAPALGVTMVPCPVHDGDEIDTILTSLAADPPDAVTVVTDPMKLRKQRITLNFLTSHGLPSRQIGTGRPADDDRGELFEGELAHFLAALKTDGAGRAEAFREPEFAVDQVMPGLIVGAGGNDYGLPSRVKRRRQHVVGDLDCEAIRAIVGVHGAVPISSIR